MTKKTLFSLAIGSLLLFSIGGWVIMEYIGPTRLPEVLKLGSPLGSQLIFGIIIGLLLGLAAWSLINHRYLHSAKDFFVGIIGPWKLTWLEIALVSICAGVGEEILFRGAIQPFLGVGWTSFLFVLLHGYINPFNAPLTIYGLFMILAIAILGVATIHLGLVVAMVAHTVIDMVLLYLLSGASIPSSEDTSQE